MGVTAIRRIENRSSGHFGLDNRENIQQNGSIEPATYDDVEIWIPWCSRQDDFARHHLALARVGGGPRWCIWQANRRDGDRVRISDDGRYWDSGHWISGDSKVNGNRRLIIYDDRVELTRHIPPPDLPGNGSHDPPG